jgi:hypothetical protein
MIIKFLLSLLAIFALTLYAQDSTITVKVSDLEKIAPGTIGALKTVVATQTAEQLIDKRIERYGKWVGLGNEIGVAVNGCLQALNSELVKLSETKIGKIAIFLVIWKVLYQDVVGLLVGIPILIGWTILFIWVLRRCFMARVMTYIRQGEKIEEIVNDKWNTEKWTALCVAGIIYIIVAAVVIGCIIL